MTEEVGTLKELGVKPGDVVKCMIGVWHAETGETYTVNANRDICDLAYGKTDKSLFRIISRAADAPKLWRDMTPEEKGTLLLAHHEGKVIEYWKRGTGGWEKLKSGFYDNEAYRVKPEPKIETIERFWYGHRITFNLIDGKPDCASVKMETIA